MKNGGSRSVTALYEASLFEKLYQSVFPDQSTADKKMRDAYDHFERHFDLQETTTNFDRNLYIEFLFMCFYYSDEENKEWVENANITADQLNSLNEILSNDIYQKTIDSFLASEWKKLGGPIIENPPKALMTADTFLGDLDVGGFGDFIDSIGPLVPVLQASRDAAKFRNVTLMNSEYLELIAEMYANVPSASTQLRSAIAQIYAMGQDGTNEAYKNMIKAEAAAGSLSSMAYNGAVTAAYKAFLPLAASAATASGGAVGAAALAPVVAEGAALTIGMTALGIALGSFLENALKFVDDCLVGSNAKRGADLDLYFIDIIRYHIMHTYQQQLERFKADPSVYNARKLFSASRLMFSTLLTENQYAHDCAVAYNSAGLITELIQQNNFKHFIEQTETRHDDLKKWKNQYTSNALSAYFAFENAHVNYINYNVNGGSFVGLEKVGINTSHYRQKKIDSIPVVIAKAVPTWNGYAFLGWSTSATATSADTQFAPGKSYSVDGDITLYAVWKPAAYVISFNANGGMYPSGQTVKTLEKNHGTAVKLSVEDPKREGYKFMGWATKANTKSVSYHTGDSYSGNQSLNLYAVWQDIEAQIVYDYGDGAGTKTSSIIGCFLHGEIDISCFQINVNIVVDILITCGVQNIVEFTEIVQYAILGK